MRKAVAHTLAALDAAAEVDFDRTEEDRQAFRELREGLELHAARIAAADGAMIAYDHGLGMRLQARVHVGDVILDRGVRAANAETKRALSGKSGLDQAYVFGAPIEGLVRAPLRSEPNRVLEAVARLDDVVDFERKGAIREDLTRRATNQERLLGEREQGTSQRGRVAAECVKAVLEASHALIRTKAALDPLSQTTRIHWRVLLRHGLPAAPHPSHTNTG